MNELVPPLLDTSIRRIACPSCRSICWVPADSDRELITCANPICNAPLYTRRGIAGVELALDEVITHSSADPADRKHRLCRCAGCGDVHRCDPRSDFFTKGLPPHEGKPLFCDGCFRSWANAQIPARSEQ